MAVDADDFKAGLLLWGSGVTIVTARAGEEIHGMTVSAFCSVSLDPPLVLVCADKASNTLGVIERGGCFAANILANDQQAMSNKFASKEQEWERFDGLEIESGPTGAPLIPGCLATLDCRVVARHEAGDHVIYVGSVEEIRRREGEPLMFCEGQYGAFVPLERT